MCDWHSCPTGDRNGLCLLYRCNAVIAGIGTIFRLPSLSLWYIIIEAHMPVDSRQRARRQQALSAQGATHPHPQAVTDPLFRDSAFFDPNDLVQVKYEMLR